MELYPRRRRGDNFPMDELPEAFKHYHGSIIYALQDAKPPEEVIDQLLQTGCDFYEADWICALDVDLELGIWTPIRWYNAITRGMTKTLLKGDFQYSADFVRWVKALEEKQAVHVVDLEKIRKDFPEEFAYYDGLNVQSLIAVPYYRGTTGFLVVKNPHRNVDNAGALSLIAYMIAHELMDLRWRQKMRYQMRPIDVEHENDVVIRLFGGLEIRTIGGVIPFSMIGSSAYARIIMVLAALKEHEATARKLAECLYPDKDPGEGAENIRKVIYRFRKDYGAIFGKNQLIVTSNSVYQLNPYYRLRIDLKQFDDLRKTLKKADGEDQKVSILKSLVKLYRGNIQFVTEDDHWLTSLYLDYQNQYMICVEELCELLFRQEQYNEVHHFASKALGLIPDNETMYYWMYRSLQKRKKTSQAMQVLSTADIHLPPDSNQELRRMLRGSAER